MYKCLIYFQCLTFVSHFLVFLGGLFRLIIHFCQWEQKLPPKLIYDGNVLMYVPWLNFVSSFQKVLGIKVSSGSSAVAACKHKKFNNSFWRQKFEVSFVSYLIDSGASLSRKRLLIYCSSCKFSLFSVDVLLQVDWFCLLWLLTKF